MVEQLSDSTMLCPRIPILLGYSFFAGEFSGFVSSRTVATFSDAKGNNVAARGKQEGGKTRDHRITREITCGFPRRSVQPSISNLEKYVGFKNQVSTSIKNQENHDTIDLRSLGSILNQTKVLGLKVNFKQSLRMKSGLPS
jgi:hypothetical protein